MIKLLNILGEDHIIEILTVLSESPKRFIDIEIKSGDKTKTRKLDLLKDAGLIKTVLIKIDKREKPHYALTDKGREVLAKAKELAKL